MEWATLAVGEIDSVGTRGLPGVGGGEGYIQDDVKNVSPTLN